MDCPYCGTPAYTGAERCGRCGGTLGPAAAEVCAPRWQAVGSPLPPVEAPGGLTVGQYLAALVLGLLPFAGLAYCLFYAFGQNAHTERRSLARAMLWLHGAALFLTLCGLCAWVFALAAQML